VPLKKPKEFYTLKPNTSLDEVKESATPEKVETISGAFNAFKTNLNHVQSISDFTNKFDTFESNIEKVDALAESIEDIRGDIQELIKKEDLDSAMTAHLLFVEESIRSVQDKVKTVNSKTLLGIKKEFSELSETVNGFIGEEVPSYKKLIVDSERRVDSRFIDFKEDVKHSFDDLSKDVYSEVATITGGVEALNEESLSSIKEDVQGIGSKVNSLLTKELPKYKKFFAETEVKTEERIQEIEKSVEDVLGSVQEDYKDNIKDIRKSIKQYKTNLAESKLSAEKELGKVSESLKENISTLDQKISTLDLGLTAIQEEVNERGGEIEEILSKRITTVEHLIKDSKNLSEVFNDEFNEKIFADDKKLKEFASKITKLENSLSEEILEIQENLDTSTSKYHTDLKSNVDLFEETISKQFKELEINFTVNEKHVDKAISTLKGEFKDLVEELQVNELEQKNKELTGKIQHLEEVLEKFNEKETELLTEGLLNIPPNVDNSDPLTPLDKRYVTIEQLSEHYRLFVNRVQQQLATFGGGGEVFLARMEDVAVGSGIQTDGYVLKWDTDSSLFVPGEASSSIAGINTTGTSYFKDVEVSGDLDVSGDLVYDEATARNWNVSGVATANRLFVTSDARITGILTVGSGSITLDGDNNNVNIGTGVTIYGAVGVVSAVTVQDSGGAKLADKASIGLAIALG
jgi:hypothetical protein